MNTSQLRNPAPSNGMKDWPVLGRHASHSEPNKLPGPGIGSLMAPSHSTNVHQLMANPNATYPFFVGAFQNGWQQAYTEGMPLFVNLQNDRGEKTTISGRHQSHNIMASIQVLNYYLTLGSSDPIYIEQHIRKHRLNESLIPMYPTKAALYERFQRSYFSGNGTASSGASMKYVPSADQRGYWANDAIFGKAVTSENDDINPGNFSQLYTGNFGDGNDVFDQSSVTTESDIDERRLLLKRKLETLRDIMFIEDFNSKWKYMGVVLTDMDLSSRYQKLFNLNVRGRSRIFNIWNSKSSRNSSNHGRRDHVQKGDELYLTLKKVSKDDTTFTTPDGTQMPIIPTGDAVTFIVGGTDVAVNNDDKVWQLVPTRKTLTNINKNEKFGNGATPNFLKEYETGSAEMEHNIHIGKVLNSISKRPEQYFTHRACREHTQMILLPMLEIAIRIGGY
tara:strand:- start:1456 stop:2799 length:1344 start_codon:yes stop_codon:yes gene_type:complete